MNKAQVHEVRASIAFAMTRHPSAHITRSYEENRQYDRRAFFRFLRSWTAANESIEYACDRLRRQARRKS